MDSILSYILKNITLVIRQESSLLGGLKGGLQNIKDELEQMQAFLKRAEFLVENDPGLKAWVGQVRDVAYDIEDVLDEFMMRCTHRYSNGLIGQVGKIKTKINALKARREIASEVQEIRSRIDNISKTYKRFQDQYGGGVDASGSGSHIMRNTLYDRRGDALLLQESDLVGIEDSKSELKGMLLSDDVRRNVISVVGMGGSGKTTLVKKVFDDVNVRSHFTHVMWITVSEYFKLGELLKATIKRLCKEQNRAMSREDIQDLNLDGLKELILESLQSEKYLVVYDDVWSQADWDSIHLAFPRNKCGSRVVITTRNLELSQAACNTEDGGFVYPLKPLGEKESRWLFCKTTFGDSTYCPQHLTRSCQNILRACEGLPLAIVVMGSTLATKSRRTEEWDLFYRSLGIVYESNSQMNVMMKLLSLSYYDLPNHLRICLLYLSMFPEDAFIEKMRLFRLWAAEGLVQQIQGMTIEEVAEGYLYELLKRSLVIVAEFCTDGRVKSVRVHDIVRLAILLKANEQNIAIIINPKGLQCLPTKARRLAIHGTFDSVNELDCESLRSLVLYDSTGQISEIVLHDLLGNGRRLLKVLDLRGASLNEVPNEIFSLFLLKYLSLRNNTKVSSIPKSIEKLQNLETLDLKHTSVRELPVEILKLRKLRHILVYQYRAFQPGTNPFHVGSPFRAPYKIGGLISLQKLSYIEADVIGDVNIVKEVGELSQLRRLGLTKLRREYGKELCYSIGKLTRLCSLSLVSLDEEEVMDLQYPLSSNLPYLRTLYLTARLEKPPQWISSLQGLSGLIFRYSRFRHDPLEHLQDLPNLGYLYLDCAYEGDALCFKAGGFPRLKRLVLTRLTELRRLIVEEGSTPLLEELKLRECNSMAQFPDGIHHLVHLQRLQFVDMSDMFINQLENMEKESNGYQWLLQVSMVVIRNFINGKWHTRSLDQATGSFIQFKAENVQLGLGNISAQY